MKIWQRKINAKKVISIFLLIITLSCQDDEFGRQLIVSSITYGGEKVINPVFKGEILDVGNSPIMHHGFVWDETDDPDLTGPNTIDLGLRESKGIFSSVIPDLFQNTIYYIRAYATAANGKTVYGKTLEYKTPQQTTPLSTNSGGAGTIIIIVGVFDFDNQAEITVKFGDFEATILLATSTALQVVVPPGIPPGTVKISIIIKDGEPEFVPDDFTVLQAPVIEAINPLRAGPGSTIKISGINFISTPSYNTVLFDSIPALVTQASPTELVTIVPEGLPLGDVAISVRSGGLRTALARNFKTSLPASFESFSPLTAPVGARLTILGENFGNDVSGTKVKFGDADAPVAFVSDSLISVAVPSGINVGANVAIKLTTNGTTLTLTPNFIVKASSNAAVVVNTNISVNTTWAKIAPPGEVDYLISSDVNVTSELTVAPGVIIEFENGKSLSISGATSALIAKGTATNPIVFTGKEKVKGAWRRILFYESNNVKNELDFVEISYGGDGVAMVDTWASSGVKLRISNSTFSHSKSTALSITGTTSLDVFSNNTFHNNSLSPMTIPVREVGKLEANNRFTGNNGRNAVEIVSSTLNNFNETVWNKFSDGSPYFIAGTITVNSGMKVMPGVVMNFNLNTALSIVGAAAYLSAKGTSTNRILFTGADRTFKGSWDKLYFLNTLSPKNELDQVEVTHGGSFASSRYNIQLDNSNVKFSNTVISNGAGGGLFVNDGSTAETSFTTFADNNLYPIYIAIWHIQNLDVNSNFINNGQNKVFVRGSTLNDPNKEHVWKPLKDGIPYFIAGDLYVNSGVVIQPGGIFTFNSNIGIRIGPSCCNLNSGAYLSAKGTETEKIIFTGSNNSSKGSWGRIFFSYTNSLKNELDYVDITNGTDASLSIDDSFVKITNSSVSNSSGTGLYIDDASTFLSFANNSFSNNNGYPLVVSVDQIGNLDANSKFSNNTFNKVNVYGSSVNIPAFEQVWPSFADGTNYYVSGDLFILSGVSIQPGAIVTFGSGIGIRVGPGCCNLNSGAYLSAKGTETEKIIFTGSNNSFKGSWERILFSYSNSPKNELEYVDITNGTDASLSIDDSFVKITNSSVSNSSGTGLYIDDASTFLSFANNSFSNNNGYPLVVSVDQIGNLDANSKFSNNTFNKVNVYGSSVNIPAFEQVWPSFADGTNYYVSDDLFIFSGVSIQPGAIFTFKGNTGIRVGPGCCNTTLAAYLVAKGTATKPITFTRDLSETNFWDGLSFSYSTNNKTALEFVICSYASNGILADNCFLSLKTSTLTNSNGYGIFRSGSCTLNSDIKTSNTFLNNLLGDTNF